MQMKKPDEKMLRLGKKITDDNLRSSSVILTQKMTNPVKKKKKKNCKCPFIFNIDTLYFLMIIIIIHFISFGELKKKFITIMQIVIQICVHIVLMVIQQQQQQKKTET